MPNPLISLLIRTRFALTTRGGATGQIRRSLARYLALAEGVDAARGTRPVRVPPMPGVDEDMRDWSFFMILEHNAIVNRAMTSVVGALARGEEPPGGIDPKRDVMPSVTAGPEQVAKFRSSVEDYLALLPSLGRLRGGRTRRHPVFGDFDAHRWHCMLGFHLSLHERQARYVLNHAVVPDEGGWA